MEELPPVSAVMEVIGQAFEPFLANNADVHLWDGVSTLEPPSDGLHMVYVYGHAWREQERMRAAWMSADAVVIESPCALLERLLPVNTVERVILVLDCCHAAAVDDGLPSSLKLRLVVSACAADEKAIALIQERATRLSLALSEEVGKAHTTVDLTQAIAHVAQALEGDGALRGQTVGYRMHGPAVRLARGAVSVRGPREKAVARVRNALLGSGAATALLLVLGGWFYWSHILIEVDFAGLTSIGTNVKVFVYKDGPVNNAHALVTERAIGQDSRTRIWAPASNLIVEVRADYSDRAERALNFHAVTVPGFAPAGKRWEITLPLASEVQSHPGMAYVPSSQWYHGRELELRSSTKAFWIDLRPPTVVQYAVIAESMLGQGLLQQENSFLLTWRQRSSAIDAVGLQQLRPLGKALGDILGVIEAASSSEVAAAGDIVVGTGQLPCGQCPAPMTRFEASLFCEVRSMRLPTDLEWELAVRGVDGRDYPWGSRFDPARANVPGLPEKGAPAPALKPVDAYAGERSPFGLLDTVGNAGDWVNNESGSYERVFMGATYRFNPEDATAFRMQPVTEEYSLVHEITARCAVDAAR